MMEKTENGMLVYSHRWFNSKSVYVNSPYGFVKLDIRFDDERGELVAELYDFIVYPEHQDHGHGRELMEEILRQAKKHACERVILFPDCPEWTREWYKRLGFVPDTTIRHREDNQKYAYVKTLKY